MEKPNRIMFVYAVNKIKLNLFLFLVDMPVHVYRVSKLINIVLVANKKYKCLLKLIINDFYILKNQVTF